VSIVCLLLGLYWFVLLARVLMSWIPITPGTGVEQVHSVLVSLTEPVLGPLRRAIPPMRIGVAALDLSPIILFIGIAILRAQIC
jgi:YggT family protein